MNWPAVGIDFEVDPDEIPTMEEKHSLLGQIEAKFKKYYSVSLQCTSPLTPEEFGTLIPELRGCVGPHCLGSKSGETGKGSTQSGKGSTQSMNIKAGFGIRSSFPIYIPKSQIPERGRMKPL